MNEQFRWLWLAAFGQFWRSTKVVGVPTTIFVRRMLLWTPAAALALIKTPMGTGWQGVVASALALPFFAFGFLIALGVLLPAVMRFVGLSFASFSGILGWPGRWMIGLADLMWMLEAGLDHGVAQAEASSTGVARAQLDKARSDFASSLDLGEVSLTASSVQVGHERFERPFLRDGKLIAFRGSDEHELGELHQALSGFEIRDGAGEIVVQFDHRGRGRDGLAAHPRHLDRAEWAALAEVEVASHPSAGLGLRAPVVQSLVVALVVIVSYFAGDLFIRLVNGDEDHAASATDPLDSIFAVSGFTVLKLVEGKAALPASTCSLVADWFRGMGLVPDSVLVDLDGDGSLEHVGSCSNCSDIECDTWVFVAKDGRPVWSASSGEQDTILQWLAPPPGASWLVSTTMDGYGVLGAVVWRWEPGSSSLVAEAQWIGEGTGEQPTVHGGPDGVVVRQGEDEVLRWSASSVQ